MPDNTNITKPKAETKTAQKKPEAQPEKKLKKSNIELKRIDWFDDRFYKIKYVNEAKVDIEDYLPSVTTKLNALSKPQLTSWYGDIGNREARLRVTESADRGSRIHWAWETFCSGGVVIYDPPKTPLYTPEEKDEIIKRHNGHFFILQNQDEMWNFTKLRDFHKAIKPYFTLNEYTVFDINNRDAGTMDNLFGIEAGKYMINGVKPVELKRGLYLFDAKTGNYIGNEAKMQLGAYWSCVMYMIDNGFIDLPMEDGIQGAIIGHTSAKTKAGIEGFSAILIPKEELSQYYNRYRHISAVWTNEFGSLKPKIRQLEGFIAL